MFRTILLVAFSLWLCAQPAAATIYEYKYTGQPLVLDDTPLPKDPPPLVLEPLGGILWIDEAKVPGGTLANAVLRHDCYYLDICPDADWLIRDTVFASVRSYHLLELGFDEQKRIVNWISSETDGSPDTFSTASGDGINSWDGYYSYSAPAGTWSDPKVVPLPASVLLLISALGGLGFMRPLFTSSSSERRVGANPPLGWRTRIAPDRLRA